MMLPMKLRQEVHQGYGNAVDASRGTFAFDAGGLTAPGGRYLDRPPHLTPAPVLSCGRAGGSLGAGHAGWEPCPV
jgi:hypothetical protein